MTRILGISGSPRAQATEYAVKQALESAGSFQGITTDFISFHGLNLKPCKHCEACFYNGGKCIHKDDMEIILERFLEADGVIIGSPVYTFNPTPEVNMLFNRMRAWRNHGSHEKMSLKVGGAIAVGGTRNGGQEMAVNAIINMFLAREMIVVGGSSGYYSGKVGTQNRDLEGAMEDTSGIHSAADIGARVAKVALMIKGEWHG